MTSFTEYGLPDMLAAVVGHISAQLPQFVQRENFLSQMEPFRRMAPELQASMQRPQPTQRSGKNMS